MVARRTILLLQPCLTTKIKLTTIRKTVWIHAASLGEFEQGRPLIEMIRRNQPDYSHSANVLFPVGI